MAGVRVPANDLAASRQLETLGGPFVCLQLRHRISLDPPELPVDAGGSAATGTADGTPDGFFSAGAAGGFGAAARG